MNRLLCFSFLLTATTLNRAAAQMRARATDEPYAASADSAPSAPQVYLAADEMPSFPGGAAAMLKFMGSHLNYPSAALEQKLSGKVHVRFTVDAEGRLHDPEVVRGLGGGLDEEALRLVRLMPWWNPGKIQGQPVWVTMTLPITFRAL